MGAQARWPPLPLALETYYTAQQEGRGDARYRDIVSITENENVVHGSTSARRNPSRQMHYCVEDIMRTGSRRLSSPGIFDKTKAATRLRVAAFVFLLGSLQ